MARVTTPIRATRTSGGNIVAGRAGAVRSTFYIRGGDDLYRALVRLEKGVADQLVVQATQAGGDVLAEEWHSRVESQIGRGPGVAHYADAIYARARPGKRGATGIVALKKVPLDKGEAQPGVYAPRFEFGSTVRSLAQFKAGVTHAGRARAAVPTLRPAFDAAREKMVDAIGDTLRRLIAAATP